MSKPGDARRRRRGARPASFALAGEAVHRGHVVGEAALVLVQAHLDALRAPVREHAAHVLGDLGRADDQIGRVADPLLALVHLGQVGRPATLAPSAT